LKRLTPLQKEHGRLLAHFLNEDPDEIDRIFQLCRKLEEQPPEVPGRVSLARQSLIGKINAEIRQALEFAIVPEFESFGLGLSIVWRPAHPNRARLVLTQFTGRVFGPHTAVQVIMEMTSSGILNRIRQCEIPNCRKWFMAVTTKKVVCSDACRFAKYQAKHGSRANYVAGLRKYHRDHPNAKTQKRAAAPKKHAAWDAARKGRKRP
jgi:hypothetical protein